MRWSILLFLFLLTASMPAPAAAQTTSDARMQQPAAYALSAAYPNPFNPQTSFTLTVERTQRVTVEVFNLLGVRIQELYDGEMTSGVSRTFTFIADDIPTGIYLYRVQGETFTAARQVTLLR